VPLGCVFAIALYLAPILTLLHRGVSTEAIPVFLEELQSDLECNGINCEDEGEYVGVGGFSLFVLVVTICGRLGVLVLDLTITKGVMLWMVVEVLTEEAAEDDDILILLRLLLAVLFSLSE